MLTTLQHKYNNSIILSELRRTNRSTHYIRSCVRVRVCDFLLFLLLFSLILFWIIMILCLRHNNNVDKKHSKKYASKILSKIEHYFDRRTMLETGKTELFKVNMLGW